MVEAGFQGDTHILMFPAGLCSRKRKGIIQDLEWKKTFIIPFLSALVMGVFCYVFYQGMYFILMKAFAAYLPIRVIIMAGMLCSVVFAVMVYFVMELKLKGVTEEELRGFPKGGALVRLAKKSGLL